MFDSQGQTLESKLRMTYKTNLNILGSESQEIDSLIKSSFFSNTTEQQKIQAFQRKKQLEPRIEQMKDFKCEHCPNEAISGIFALY